MNKYMEFQDNRSLNPIISEVDKPIFILFIELASKNEPTEFIEQRKYNKEIIKKLKIGYCNLDVMNQLMQKYDKEKLMSLGFIKSGHFPYLNCVIILFNPHYFAARTSSKSEKTLKNLFPKGIRKDLFHIPNNSDSIYVCEGETDAIALTHAHPNSDILSIGGVQSQSQLDLLDVFGKIIYAFDNDEEGRKGLHKAMKKLNHSNLFKLEIPKEFKDVDEVFFNKGVEFLKNLPEILLSDKDTLIELKSVAVIVQQDIQTPKFIVEGLIPEGGITYLASPPGIGKSLLSIFISLCISSGRNFFNKKVIRGKVLYFDSENGILCAYDRIKKIVESHEFNNEDLENFYYSIFPNIRFNLKHDSFELLIEIQKKYLPDVIIFDSLVRFMEGSENDAEAAKMVFDFLKVLLKSNPNLTIIILHHLTKNNAGGMNALRGSSELAAAASTILMLQRKQQGLKITIEKSRFVASSDENTINYCIDKAKGIFFELCDMEKILTDALSLAENDFWQWVEDQQIETFSTKNLQNYLKSKSHSKNSTFNLVRFLLNQGNIIKLSKGKYEIKNKRFKTEEEVEDEQD